MERVAVVTRDENWGVAAEIEIVVNWLEELKRLTPIDRPP